MCSLKNLNNNKGDSYFRANRSSQKRTLDITPERRASVYATIERLRRQICERSIQQGRPEQDVEAVQDAFWTTIERRYRGGE